MAGTILGKRSRLSESSTVFASSTSPRVKRRAQVHVHDDGDASPICVQFKLNSDNPDAGRENLGHVSKRVSTSTPHVTNNCVSSPPLCKANRLAKSFAETHDGNDNDENILQLPTPKTPRHRDALSKKVPITPRHRIGLVGKPLTPRSLRNPSSTGHTPTVYSRARQLFIRSSDPSQLVGRATEHTELHQFIQNGVYSKSGGCLYISGPPGTGKSALVGEVCEKLREDDGLKMAYINCMSVKSSSELRRKLVNELLGDDQILESHDLEKLQNIFFPKKKAASPMYVVTLDEIDHLLSLDLEALYTLFEWSLGCSSRLIILGIANAIDLTDRFLPRLKARNLKPQLLPFLPYTAAQIAEIVITKLHSLHTEGLGEQPTFVPVVHPTAIQLCAKKVASQTGDLRKAFDIIRRTIDLIETETMQKLQHEWNLGDLEDSPSKKPLAENPNLSTPSRNQRLSRTAFTPLTAPRATIAHVARISAAALGNGTTQRLTTLNLQQKAALCTLISYQKTSSRGRFSIFATPSKTDRSSPPTVRKLHEAYSGLCRIDDALHPLTATEFADVISGLETLGLVGEEKRGGIFGTRAGTPSRKGKGMGGIVSEDRRVVCFVDEKEIKASLDGVSASLLQGLLTVDA